MPFELQASFATAVPRRVCHQMESNRFRPLVCYADTLHNSILRVSSRQRYCWLRCTGPTWSWVGLKPTPRAVSVDASRLSRSVPDGGPSMCVKSRQPGASSCSARSEGLGHVAQTTTASKPPALAKHWRGMAGDGEGKACFLNP